MKMIIALIAVVFSILKVTGTPLSDSAATMAPGTWKALNTGLMPDLYTKFGPCFVYSNNALWDSSTQKIIFTGGNHGSKWQGLLFDAVMNVWRSIPLAQNLLRPESTGTHTYNKLTMDTRNHVAYFFETMEAGMTLFKFNPVTETWSVEIQNGTPPSGYLLALAYFPEMNGLVHVQSGTVRFFDLNTKTWSLVRSGLLMGDYHNLAEYSPVHKCILFGGGNSFTPQPDESKYMYKMDSTGDITTLKKTPFGIGIHQGELTCDRVSGTYLLLRDDSLYGYDIQDDYWFNLGPNPGLNNIYTVVTPIPEYGVVAFLGGAYPNNMWLYKYAGAYDTLPVIQVTFQAQLSSIEQYLSTNLDVIATYQGGAKDTSNTKCGFIVLDTNILSLSSVGGVVVGKNVGSGRIVVLKRGATDTLTITVVPSTAVLDSVRINLATLGILSGDLYPLQATGYFHKNSQGFSRNLDTAAQWTSLQTGVATVAAGMVTGISAGGPIVIIAELGGKSDTTLVTIWPKPAFIKRINFQVASTPWSYGWLADNGAAFSAGTGYGWVGAGGLTSRDDRTGSTNFLLKSFVSTSTSTQYRVAVPDGDYILKLALGDNQYGSTDTVWHGNQVLLTHSGQSNATDIDTVTVTGGGGILLGVRGVFNYLVVISKEGIDINQVADDGGNEKPMALESAAPVIGGIDLAISPNPIHGRATIRVKAQSISSVRIFDLRGRPVANLTARGHQRGILQYAWETQNLPSGIYIVKVSAGGRTLSKRFVIQK